MLQVFSKKRFKNYLHRLFFDRFFVSYSPIIKKPLPISQPFFGLAGKRVFRFAGFRVYPQEGKKFCWFAGKRSCGFARKRVCRFTVLQLNGLAGFFYFLLPKYNFNAAVTTS
jgi:hypothetical protein